MHHFSIIVAIFEKVYKLRNPNIDFEVIYLSRWLIGMAILILATTIVNADLSEFPGQFTSGGSFDGTIVIGESGSAKDYQAGVELAIGLQYSLGGDNQVSVFDPGPTDNFRFMKNDNMLESGEPISKIISTVSDNEFSLLEEHSIYNTQGLFEYSQYLNLGESGYTWFGTADGIPSDDLEIPQAYVVFEENKMAYEYQLIFKTPLESRIESSANGYGLKDLEDEVIIILGNEYTIIETEHTENNSLSITLLGGAIEDMVGEYEKKTYTLDGKQYEVEIIGIFYKGNVIKTQIRVNDEMTEPLGIGDTFTLTDKTMIGIKELLENEGSETGGSDMVQFYLGADKMVLSDPDISDRAYNGSEYEIGSNGVTGTDVNIIGIDCGLFEDCIFKLESISIKWTPDETHYVPVGSGLLDIVEEQGQIFTQSFDFIYEGPNMENTMEMIELVPSGSTGYKLKIMNKAGDLLEIPLFYSGLTRFGTSTRTTHVVEGVNITKGDYFLITSDGYKAIHAAKGTTHLLKFEGIRTSTNKIAFNDLGSGEDIEIVYAEGATSASMSINGESYLVEFSDVGDEFEIQVDLDNNGSIDAGSKPVIVTMYGMNIDLEVNPLTTYEYERLTIYTKKKESNIAVDTLNDYLVNIIGPSIQAGYNASFGAFGLAITSNPVTDTNATVITHDSIRITVKDTDGELDILNMERCTDSATPSQIANAVDSSYDATIAVIHANSFLPYPTLGENIYATFMDSVCYPGSTTIERFLWTIGESDDEIGSSSYSNLVEVIDSSGPDTVAILAPNNQVDQIVYLRAGTSDGSEEQVVVSSFGGKITGSAIDNEIMSPKNVLLIGGPCANKLSAEVMGVTDNCAAGYERGKGRITLGEYQGKSAVVISGYTGEDTLKAAMVLSNYEDYSLFGDDLEVTGEFGSLTIAPYTYTPVTETPVVETPVAVEAPAPVVPACAYPNLASGSWDVTIRKLGITKDLSPTPIVETNGLVGTVSFVGGETFESQFGVDWVQYVIHILEEDCVTSVTDLTFKWVDGDNDKTMEFTLAEPGCDCMMIGDGDATIDDAKIEFTSETMVVMFGAG